MAKRSLSEVEKHLAQLEKRWDPAKLSSGQLLKLEAEIDATQLEWMKLKEHNPPMISVLMSVYNTEKFVGSALKSILDQTFKDFEVVVIDDGSTDKSIEIINSFKDNRIRIIHQTNHGLVYSFNKGVRLSRGEFIARMDSDDISLPSRFERELSWLVAGDKRGLVGTCFSYIDEHTSLPTGITMVSPTKHIDLVRMMYLVNPFGHGSIMMRRTAVNQAGGYHAEYEPSEDADLWRRIALDWEIGQIPHVLYLWRFHPASISRRKSEVSNSSAAKTVQNVWDGPIGAKSTREIIRDARFYRSLDSSVSERIYNQYIEQQITLAFEFLVHGRLRTGYRTAWALLRLRPRALVKLWKTILLMTVKYTLKRSS